MADLGKQMLPMKFTYVPETHVIAAGDPLEVGPSDLVFFQGMSSGSKPSLTFVVLRRINPE